MSAERFNVVFHPSWWNQNCDIDFSEPFWENPEVRIKADVRMRRELYRRFGVWGLGEKDPQPRPILGSDMLACGFLTSMIMGCKVRFSPNDAPEVLCANLDDTASASLRVPDFDTNPAWKMIQEQIDRMQKQYGYVETCMDFNGIQNLALDLRGQNLFLDYYDEDSSAGHLLDICYEVTRQTCRRLLNVSPHISAGVSNIVRTVLPEVVLHSNCSVEMISEQTYRQWLLPYEIRLAEEFPVYGIHHCGQSMQHVVKAYAEVPNLRLAEVGAFSDLAAVAKALPPDIRINARYSPVRLRKVTDGDLYTELKQMTETVPGQRLSISCVGIDSAVPDERIERFCAYCTELLQ